MAFVFSFRVCLFHITFPNTAAAHKKVFLNQLEGSFPPFSFLLFLLDIQSKLPKSKLHTQCVIKKNGRR